MAVSVQKYIKNMAKSVAYTTSDVLQTKFEYIKEFKDENNEVFKNIYHSVYDYRTTFARVKKVITNNKIIDAARVGYDSVLYSITTGDFYAKNRENEISEKYGGSIMADLDIDDDDFNWDNEDISTGEKVIATAVKKNSKINTALTVEAIAKTGKAQMDVAKENTMLLYTQNERMLNKLDTGFENILGFLKQNGEQTAKIQNQMNDNLNKFMTNVDNNIAKLTAQMDELLKMQRNMYNPQKQEEQNKRAGYDDLISRNGVLNIREYAKHVKRQAFNTLNSVTGNGLSMLLGDTTGENSNLLAQFAATPFRSTMTTLMNKALGARFDKAAAELNTTLTGIIPSLIAKINNAGKKSDNGIMGFLGKIFGIKDKSNETINPGAYNKGAIPFDGITKRAITDVIPYYLRKMTSALTGGQEMTYNYESGRWMTVRSLLAEHKNVNESALNSTTSTLLRILESNMNGRRLSNSFENKKDYDSFMNALRQYASRVQNAGGDVGSIKESDLRGAEREVHNALRHVLQISYSGYNNAAYNGDRRYVERNGKRIESGLGRSAISTLSTTVREQIKSQNSTIKSINAGNSILYQIDAEGLAGVDPKNFIGKAMQYNQHGDMTDRYVQELPMSQSLLRAKDEYGYTIYNYLRDMGGSLRFIKANSIYLSGIEALGNLVAAGNNSKRGKKRRKSNSSPSQENWDRLFNASSNQDVKYDNKKDEKYSHTYYQDQYKKSVDNSEESYKRNIRNAKKRAAEKGRSFETATSTDFHSSNDEIGLARIMMGAESDIVAGAIVEEEKRKKKESDERWKKLEDIFGSDRAKKFREASEKFNKEQTLSKNMEKVKDQGFGANLVMFTKWASDKVGKPGDLMADNILKIDYWLQKVIYGEDLRPEDQKTSFFGHIKKEIKDGFTLVSNKISETFEKVRDKIKPYLEKPMNFLFGKPNSDGIREGGVFGGFIGGIQKGLRKNAEDVAKYVKEQAAEKARKLKSSLKPEDREDDDDDTDYSSGGSNSGSSGNPIHRSKPRRFIDSDTRQYIYNENTNLRYNPDTATTSEQYATRRENFINHFKYRRTRDRWTWGEVQATNSLVNYQKMRDLQKNQYENFTTDAERAESKQRLISELSTKIQNQENAIVQYNKMQERKEELENRLEEIREELADTDPTDVVTRHKLEKEKSDVISQLNSTTGWISKQKSNIIKTKNNLEANKNKLQKIQNSVTRIKRMAVGGINKTGRPFQSVLSAGELHNGVPVPSMGIYTINPGDVIVNPANSSTRMKQATAEKNYLNNIRRNAEANDKLTAAPEEASKKDDKNTEKDTNKMAELMTNRDWTTLTSKEQRAEFLGNVASRGLIGGGLGLLVGGPLLGAAVGAASSLTKSTDAFSSLLFGKAIKDKDGNVKVDEKGNIEREDNGLISKEIMKAMPDVKKFGLGGALAGLITPLGPIGGIIAGSALGFAKNSEMFQGSLFGDGGVFSNKNINKLKKGAKNIGAGAIIGALALPGPFGILGNALIGATAGYITSTDKFKDALLGEKIDPNDPNSKRKGGIVGRIKMEMVPLKDFGMHLRDNIMDEIFGKDEGEGRKGGLFGAIRDNMVTPLIEGSKSVFQSLSNSVSDMSHLLSDTYKKLRARWAGNDFFGGAIEKLDTLSGGLIKGAGSIGRAMTKPFRLLGEDGIGGALTAGRIRKGTEISKTARERMIFRTKHKLGQDDKFYNSDKAMSNMSQDDLMVAQTLLQFGDSRDNIDKARNEDYRVLGQTIRDYNYLNRSDTKKVIKMLKEGDIAGAQRFARTRNISDNAKANMASLISRHQNKLEQYKKASDRINNSGKTAQELLKEIGLNVDTSDASSVRYMQKQLQREIAHNNAGLTDEEIEYDKIREIWADPDKSPLKNVNTGVSGILDQLKGIYAEIKLGNEYDKLSNSEKAEYNSKDDYINKNKAKLAAEPESESVEKTNIGKAGNLADAVHVNPHTNLYQKMKAVKDQEKIKHLREIADRGVRMFNNAIIAELNDPEKVKVDIEEQFGEGKDEYSPAKAIKREMTIEKFEKTYTFTVSYICTNKGDIKVPTNQEEDFEQNRDQFVSDYMERFMPKETAIDRAFDKIPSLTFGNIIKSSIKAAGVLGIASLFPLGAVVGLPALGALKVGKWAAKKFDVKGKIKRTKNKLVRGIKHKLGSHELDMDSKHQQKKDEKYRSKARKELLKAIDNDDPALNDLSNEMYGSDYQDLSEDEKKEVNHQFIENYVSSKRSKQVSGHGLVGNVKAVGRNIKSGVKNAVAGSLKFVKAKKEKAQQEETFLGKFFNRLDKWNLKRERKLVDGKKDSKLAKILKWLFVGGIAAPIIVGFVKNKIVPAVQEKIAPFLKKVGQKVIGVKNETTGEYEGGIVSGIVNPIRNFFKDKFKNIHDWFTNDGKYESHDKGMIGLLNNIKGIGEYIIELWKSGASTIYGEWLPKIVENAGRNFLPILGNYFKGLFKGLGDIFNGKGKGDFGTDLTVAEAGGETSSQGKTVMLNNGFGKKISLTVPANKNKYKFNFDTNIKRITNTDGTATFKNDKTGQSITSEKINDKDMYLSGKNKDDVNIYTKNGTNKSYIKDEETGTYIPLTEYQMAMNEAAANNDVIKDYQKKEANNQQQAGYAVEDSSKSAGTIGKIMGKSIFNLNNLKIFGGKAIEDAFKIFKKGGAKKAAKTAAEMLSPSASILGLFKKGFNFFKSIPKLAAFGIRAGSKMTKGLQEKLQTALYKRAKNIPGKIKSLPGKIKGFGKWAANTKAGKWVGGKAKNLGKWAANTKAGKWIGGKAKKLGKWVGGEAKNLGKWIGRKAAKAGKWIGGKAAKAGKWIGGKAKGLGQKATSAFKRLMQNEKVTSLKDKILNAGKKAKNLGEKLGNSKLATKIKECVKALKGKISDMLKKVLEHEKIQKLLGKVLRKNTDTIAKGAEEAVTETIEKNAETIAKKAGSITAKQAAKSFSVVSIVADFILGADDCRNILGIVEQKPSITERITAGLINSIPSIIASLAEVITGASFGAAAGVGIAMYVVSVIATVIISIDSIRSAIIDLILKLLDSIGVDVSGIKKKRQDAKDAVAAYNEKNGTNISIEEYNNIMGYKSVQQKGKEGTANAWSAAWGYDSGTKNDIKDKTSEVKLDNKKSNKTRKKLATIFSSIWQSFGKSDFNYYAEDEDGNELSGKEKLNANQLKFENLASEIITSLVTLLDQADPDVISDVYSNSHDFVGFVDSRNRLRKVFKKGKEDPSTQFNIDEEHASWKRIKAIAGVCAIINEIFEPLNDKATVTGIIVSKMIPAYFTSKGSDSDVIDWANENVDNSVYNLNMTQYDAEESNYIGTQAIGSETASGIEGVATNANANSKLSPIKGKLAAIFGKGKNLVSNIGDKVKDTPFGKIGMKLSEIIDNAISSITGGFENVEDMFKNLSSKNKSTNESIDTLSLLPIDKKYWKINLDKKNPFLSSIFNFMESMNRVVKAPFALAAASLGSGLDTISSNVSESSGNSNTSNNSNSGSDNSNTNSTSSSGTKSGGMLSKLAKAGKSIGKKVVSAFKGLFGKGRDDESGYGDDPYHIYQRDYKGSFHTTGDSENQTIADSGCGPAAAASLLRMYGKDGDMNNAVNYALNNKYKEVDGGTYPQYFNDYLNKNGISTNSNADNNDVVDSLIHNKPVILMGRDSTNSGKTPYGSKYSHYVVARGLDKNGNVIVEDSEDKNGSTRYSLADTLNNSSVRITTGKGRYGRAKDNVMDSYVGGVNSVMSAAISNIIGNVAGSINLGSSSNKSTGNNAANKVAGTKGVNGKIGVSDDINTSCGYTADQLKAAIHSINAGCSAEQFPEAAIAIEQTKGVNALFTIAVAVQEHGWDGPVGVNTTGANYGNWNVFNIEGSPNSSNGRWKDYDNLTDAFEGFGNLIMGDTYYGNGLTTPEKIGPLYCDEGWAGPVCQVAALIADHISGSGRGKNDSVIRPTFTKKFLNNVTSTISYYTNNVLSRLGATSSSSSSSNNSGTVSSGSANVDIDAETTIICGDSITWGLSERTSLGDRAMGVISGTTDINCQGSLGQTYQSQFKAHSDIIKNATDAIFFWGMNEVFANMDTESYFKRYQESIDTILGYGGRNTSNTNVYILTVIWVPENSGMGGSFNAAAIEKFNETYIKPFAQSKGYTLIDIYEDSKNIPHEAGNVHPADYQKLYEIIKAHTSGNSVSTTSESKSDSDSTTEESGSGRGRAVVDRIKELKGNINKNIILGSKKSRKLLVTGKGYDKNVRRFIGNNGMEIGDTISDLNTVKKAPWWDKFKKYIKIGRIKKIGGIKKKINTSNTARGKWGRALEDTIEKAKETSKNDNAEVTESDVISENDNGEENTKETTDTSSNSSANSQATGLISLLGQYSNALTRGVFGDFYDALYGDTQVQGVNNNQGITGSLTEGTAEENMKNMFKYMKSQGFSDNLAAGILANVRAESGFNPHILNGGATGGIFDNQDIAYGLIQWCGSASRACLYNWCTANNCDPESLDGQTKWIVAQIKGINLENEENAANASKFNGETGKNTMTYNWGYLKARGSFNTFNSYSIEEATKLWLECVERCENIGSALTTRIGYAKEILKECTGSSDSDSDSGSGRGKEIIRKATSKNNKLGSGRAKLYSSITNPATNISNAITSAVNTAVKPSSSSSSSSSDSSDDDSSSTDTEDEESKDDEESEDTPTSSSSSSSGSTTGAKTLLSKLATYTKATIKGVYGNFYDALYGSEVEESSGGDNNGGYTDGSGVIYAAAMVFEAMGRANPTFGYCWCCNRLFDLECRDGKKIDKVRPDCAGMMSAVAQYMGYYTYPSNRSTYTDTFHGLGYNVTNFWAQRICDKDGNVSPDWEYKDFDPNDRQPGDMLIRDDVGHIDMYVFTDTNGRVRGFNAGSGGFFPDGHCDSEGSGIEDSYKLAKYYLEHGNQLPTNDGSFGAGTIQDNEALYVIRYKGSSGSGRGKEKNQNKKNISNTSTNEYKKASIDSGEHIKKVPWSVQQNIDRIGREGLKAYKNQTGRGILKSLDEVKQNSINRKLFSTSSNNLSSSNISSTNNNTRNNHLSKSSYIGENTLTTNTSIDLGQLINLIGIIANNSDKIDTVLQLLGAIATNTENTTTAVTNKNNKSSNTGGNGLSALRNALDSNSSGIDIAKAVYQIAQN